MFEEIKQHNALVRDQIYKGFVGGEQLLEKAHQVGDVHPNGKYVWTEYAPGKFDWRGIKKNVQKTSINNVPDADFKRITKFLQTKDPESSNDKRHLEPEGMTDKELDMFRIVAEHFRFNNGQLSERVRKNVGKWANLAVEEQSSRRKAKKVADEKGFSIEGLKKQIKDVSNLDAIKVDCSSAISMRNAMRTMFSHFGLKNSVDVKWNSHSFIGGEYNFYVDGKDVQGYKVHAKDRNMGYGNFVDCVNDCIAHAIIKNNKLKDKEAEEVESLFSIWDGNAPKWKIKTQ